MSQIKIRKIDHAQDREFCFQIRTRVFVEEQHVSLEEEMDGLDDQADHYLLMLEDSPAATARVRYPEPHLAKIERVAVLRSRRGLQLGRRLMDYILQDIEQNPDIRLLKLGAQIQVVEFYEKLGFEAYGDEFLDAGIRHRWMKRASKIKTAD